MDEDVNKNDEDEEREEEQEHKPRGGQPGVETWPVNPPKPPGQ